MCFEKVVFRDVGALKRIGLRHVAQYKDCFLGNL